MFRQMIETLELVQQYWLHTTIINMENFQNCCPTIKYHAIHPLVASYWMVRNIVMNANVGVCAVRALIHLTSKGN